MPSPTATEPARVLALRHFYGDHFEESKALDPAAERTSIEHDTATLTLQAQEFQQTLRAKLAEINAPGLHRAAATRISRVEMQQTLLAELAEMHAKSRDLYERIGHLRTNYSIDDHPEVLASLPALEDAHAAAGALLTMWEWHTAARKQML